MWLFQNMLHDGKHASSQFGATCLGRQTGWASVDAKFVFRISQQGVCQTGTTISSSASRRVQGRIANLRLRGRLGFSTLYFGTVTKRGRCKA
ncbi:hypothetical protein GT037_010237 [Alternaria burnsii]|uniref:Uncharacterized protein n=1 Tax=Alternaria burnsii TaxID=1187904 RepID=A0A8H7E9P6_9PLEO|nr:uncharacterized protein GT037_010237 [Alternaria burnsii]KAF7671715.1 hypothetical protein GT037_010237 [Alternaria burnsii]